jgi:serine/threonine protein kinase
LKVVQSSDSQPKSFTATKTPGEKIHLEPVVADTYELIRPIGEGGFSWVFMARHCRIPSLKVAVKILKATHAFDGSSVRRFGQEAEAAARLESRHSVKVIDIGTTTEGFPFLALELIRGVPLDSVLKQHGRLKEVLVGEIARDVLLALEEAHDNELIHRDLKPSNIFLRTPKDSSGLEATVIDFGIAHIGDDAAADDLPNQPMTIEGGTICTPAYAAPELLKGDPEKQSDLYALGLVMAEMLDGVRPYADINDFLAASKQLEKTPVPLGEFSSESILAPVIRKACAKKLSDRYESASLMLRDLRTLLRSLRSTDADEDREAIKKLVTDHVRQFEDNEVLTSSVTLKSGMLDSAVSSGPGSGNRQNHPSDSLQTQVSPQSASQQIPGWPNTDNADGQQRPRKKRRWTVALVALLVIVAGAAGFYLSDLAGEDGDSARASGLFGIFGNSSQEKELREISGTITADTNWTADGDYLLKDIVFVENNAELTIQPGTTIRGSRGSALVVTAGSRLLARGTADQPITFTSANDKEMRSAGDWGGVVLLGNAPTNTFEPVVEGLDPADERARYGGSSATDSCGFIEHTVIEYAGYEASANNELNALTLAGCGSGTIIRDTVLAHALDDGLEIFGGTVNLARVVIIKPGDDGLDWDYGWTGKAQHLIVLMGTGGDSAIEADNNLMNPEAEPISLPELRNVTLLGPGVLRSGIRAITLRNGAGIRMSNALIAGFPFDPIDVRGTETVKRIEAGQTVFEHTLLTTASHGERTRFSGELGSNDDDGGFVEADYFKSRTLGIDVDTNPLMRSSPPIRHYEDLLLDRNSPLANVFAPFPDDEFWSRGTNYIGAIAPGAEELWFDYEQ